MTARDQRDGGQTDEGGKKQRYKDVKCLELLRREGHKYYNNTQWEIHNI